MQKKRKKTGKRKEKKRKEKIMHLVEAGGEPFEVGSMRSGSYEVGGYVCMGMGMGMCMCICVYMLVESEVRKGREGSQEGRCTAANGSGTMVCYMSLASGLLDGVGVWAVHVCSVGWAPCPTVHACPICMEGWVERVEEKKGRGGSEISWRGRVYRAGMDWVWDDLAWDGMGWDGWEV